MLYAVELPTRAEKHRSLSCSLAVTHNAETQNFSGMLLHTKKGSPGLYTFCYFVFCPSKQIFHGSILEGPVACVEPAHSVLLTAAT